MAADVAASPCAPDHSFSQMTPKTSKRPTWRCTEEDAPKLFRPEKARQDSAIDLCEDMSHSQISKSSDEDKYSRSPKPKRCQRISQVSKLSAADQRDSQVSKVSSEERHSQASKADAGSLFSILPKDVPEDVDTTSLFTFNPDDMAFNFEQFDFTPGSRLSRPFMMPDPVMRKRGSTAISRRSVVSVELIMTDFVRSRRYTQDSDTLSPTCMSPVELQRLYDGCIPRHPAFFETSTQSSVLEESLPKIVDAIGPPKRQPGTTTRLQHNKEHAVSATRQSLTLQLKHKCLILCMDRAGFAERVAEAIQMVAETKERLYRAKKDLYIREEHVREIEAHATNMKKGMEDAMRNYSSTSKELASLKAFRWECSPFVPAQILSMRQHKIHGELKMQIRDLERKLSSSMSELRGMEKKWKEAQKSLATCTRDLEKQKEIIKDKAEELRVAEEAKASSIERLDRAEHELLTTKEQLKAAKQEEATAAERKHDPHAELAEATTKAHRLSKRLSQAETYCEQSRTRIKKIKRASFASDAMLQKKLLIAKRELRDREELLSVVQKTNADLARKVAEIEQLLEKRKHRGGGDALS